LHRKTHVASEGLISKNAAARKSISAIKLGAETFDRHRSSPNQGFTSSEKMPLSIQSNLFFCPLLLMFHLQGP
jgi:hypothetical protein